MKQLKDEEASKLINEEDIKASAVEAAEQNGIVFLDEIDKVCRRARPVVRMCLVKGFSAIYCH